MERNPDNAVLSWDVLHVGRFAFEAALLLDTPGPDLDDYPTPGEWYLEGGDAGTLEIALDFLDKAARLARTPGVLADEAQVRLWSLLRTYRLALPFEEAECGWLVDRYVAARDDWTTNSDALEEQLVESGEGAVEVEAAIDELELPLHTVLGQQGTVSIRREIREVSGAELFERWSKWRAAVEPSSGTPATARAKAALATLGRFTISSHAVRPPVS
jgi:hypothetical protein